MTTVVGVFVDPREDEKFRACGFEELPYFGDSLKAVRIEVPKLTPREMRHLDSLLPGALSQEHLGAIPPSDARYYGGVVSVSAKLRVVRAVVVRDGKFIGRPA